MPASIILTPLEAALITGIASIISGLAVKILSTNTHVSRDECKMHRDSIASLRRDNLIIFAMLRGIVSHLPNLTPDQRTELLNIRLPEGSCL